MYFSDSAGNLALGTSPRTPRPGGQTDAPRKPVAGDALRLSLYFPAPEPGRFANHVFLWQLARSLRLHVNRADALSPHTQQPTHAWQCAIGRGDWRRAGRHAYR